MFSSPRELLPCVEERAFPPLWTPPSALSTIFAFRPPELTGFARRRRRRAVEASHYRPIEVFFRFDTDENGEMNLEEFEAAVAELRIDIPSELVKVAFDSIDSDGDGSLLIEELMDYMRNERWWRTSSPLSSPRSESSSPPMGSAERAAMYGTVTIAQMRGPDRAEAIAEAAQAAWNEARERVERGASPTNDAGQSVTADGVKGAGEVDSAIETTPLNRTLAATGNSSSTGSGSFEKTSSKGMTATRAAGPNGATVRERSAKEEKAMRVHEAFGREFLGWGRASP